MKSPEEALRELMLDEIQFDAGSPSGLQPYDRQTFAGLMKVYRGRETGMSVGVLQPTLNDIKKVLGSRYDPWADGFFLMSNMIRFRSVYEINQALKAERSALKGTFTY